MVETPFEPASQQDFLDLMDEALSSEIGVRVGTNRPLEIIQQCRKHRDHVRSAGVTAYDCLTFKMTKEEAWIVKDGRKSTDG